MLDVGVHRPLLIGGLAVFATATGILLYRRRRQRNPEMQFKAVGTLEKIMLYPVKSCGGMSLTQGRCIIQGLQHEAQAVKDRHWMIIDEENRFISIRHESKMVLISTSLSNDNKYLLLDAPGMSTLQVAIDTNEVPTLEQKVIDTRMYTDNTTGKYCGKEAADWVSTFLNRPGCKLIYADSDLTLRDAHTKTRAVKIAKKGDLMAYQDDSAFNILSTASLEDLNSKLDVPVSYINFRPNFVVSGCEAFAEDSWKLIKIGDVVLRYVKCDQRCKLTVVDPETGKISDKNEPLTTLRKYRMCKPEDRLLYKEAPLLGVHLALDVEGTVKVGDIVYASF
ncbi:mitochondrial amidoxime-reducing component 1-like [Glandiceps talaboti]